MNNGNANAVSVGPPKIRIERIGIKVIREVLIERPSTWLTESFTTSE